MGYAYRGSKSSSVASRHPRNGQRRNKTNNQKRHGQYIDPARFVQAASISTEEVYVPTNKFVDFNLNSTLQANLSSKGFKVPSPIQDQSIPAALEGRDIIGIANTGTGKTAAFALPILKKLMSDNQASALVVAPTRELAQQIESEFKDLGRASGLNSTLLIGGTNIGSQFHHLRNNPRIIIGTPGRIKDHIERGSLKLERVNIIALDEVDRMLDMGFVNDVTLILSHTSPNRQSLFFSATMDDRIRKLISTFSNDPLAVSLKASRASENVHQDVVHYQTITDKIDKLHDILIKEEVMKVILFDETKRNVEKLNKELFGRGFSTDAIHGGKTQGQRRRALQKFKNGEVQILVATDVAARGIDVSDITHVINYSIPQQYDDYVHRIGRAGRAGKTGYALTFVAR